MFRVGANCVFAFLLASCNGSASDAAHRSDVVRLCVTPRLVISSTTPTIQSIHTIGDEAKLAERLLIGRIAEYAFDGRVLVGFMSTEHFNDDDLHGLAGPNDKDGYFVVDVETLKIWSGLTPEAYRSLLRDNYQYTSEPTLAALSTESQGKCVSE